MPKKWLTAIALTLGLVLLPSGASGQELAKPTRVQAGGQPIDIGGVGHAAPFLADFYGDGKRHLLVGTFPEGQLRIYRNLGTNQSPAFDAKYEVFLGGSPEGAVPAGGRLGFTPQFVDLDGDAIPDILSGSWPGHLYFFKGLGKGKFAPKDILKDKAGKPIKIEDAATVFAVDWNGDGKLDLLIGDIDGRVHLMLNLGTKAKYAFGEPRELTADGAPISVNDGYSHPIAADWDGDKLLDLLVGCGDGSVLFYKNIGTATAPKLAKPKTLVAPEPPDRAVNIRPGNHAKICVIDWNGDGKLSLLVGDSCQYEVKVEIPQKDRKILDEAHKKKDKLMMNTLEFSKSIPEAMNGPLKEETKEESAARERKLSELGDKVKNDTRVFDETLTKLAKLHAAQARAVQALGGAETKEMKALRQKLDTLKNSYLDAMASLLPYELGPFDEPPDKIKARFAKLRELNAKELPIQIEMALLQEIISPYDSKRLAGSVWLYARAQGGKE